jgi:hypothetical protein
VIRVKSSPSVAVTQQSWPDGNPFERFQGKLTS